jgi:histidinol phosphatase-like enzyme
MLLNASRDWGISLDLSFMVGDNIQDIEAGDAAGVHSILTASKTRHKHPAAMTAGNLAGAARIILDNDLSSYAALELPGDTR